MKNTILKNSIIYTFGNILPKAISFLMLPVITRFVTRDDYGIITSITAIASILGVIAALQIGSALRRCYFDYKSDQDRKLFVGTTLISVSTLNLVVVFLCFLGQNILQSVFPEVPFFPFYAIGLITVPLVSVFSVFQTVYQVEQKPIPFVIMSLLSFTLNMVFLIVFVVVNKMGARGMLLAALIANGLSLPIAFSMGRRLFVLNWSFSMFKNALSFGIKCIPFVLTGYIITYMDRVLVSRYASNEELGLYGVAFKLAGILALVNSAIIMSFEPFFFKVASTEEEKNAKNLLGLLCTKIIIVFLFFVLGMLLFYENIVDIMLDVKFSKVSEILPFLILANLFNFWDGVGSLGTKFAKKHIWFTPIYIVAGLTNLGLNILWIPKYGAVGAAMATMVSTGIVMLSRTLSSQYFWHVSMKYHRILEAVLLGLVTFFACKLFSSFDFWLILLVKLFAISVFGLYLIYRLELENSLMNNLRNLKKLFYH